MYSAIPEQTPKTLALSAVAVKRCAGAIHWLEPFFWAIICSSSRSCWLSSFLVRLKAFDRVECGVIGGDETLDRIHPLIKALGEVVEFLQQHFVIAGDGCAGFPLGHIVQDKPRQPDQNQVGTMISSSGIVILPFSALSFPSAFFI